MVALFWLVVLASPGLSAPVTVICPVEPLSHLARLIGGDRIRVVTLIPRGADPHSFEMRPSHARAVSEARGALRLGLPLEDRLLPKMRQRGVRIFQLKFDPLYDGHRQLDPHAWTSVRNGMSMARSMAEAFAELDPAGAQAYRASLSNVLSRMRDLDRRMGDDLSPFKGRGILSYHPSWNYLCQERGLVPLSVEVHGSEAGPRHMSRLKDRISREDIKVMFVEPSKAGKSAASAAKALGVSLVELDPMGDDWFAMMEGALAAFRSALSGR